MNLKKIKLYNYVYYVLLDEIDNTDLYKFVNIIDKNKVLYPKICLKQESYEEDYDYDFDERLSYRGINTCEILYPITYNPFTGEKFTFTIVQEVDITDKYKDLICKLESIEKMRSSNKKYKELNSIYDSIDLLLESPKIHTDRYSFFEDDCVTIDNLLKSKCR